MKKLEIPDGSNLLVLKSTNRKERHGKEKVQGITMRVEWWPHDNAALNMLHPGMQDSVFYVPPEEGAQEKIEGLEPVKKHLRVPGMFPVKVPMVEFSGYTIEFEHGIDETTALALYECKLDKFEVDAKEGGACSIRFNIGSSQQITPELLGLLCSKEGQEVRLVKVTPPQVKAEDKVIDGTSDAFKADHPLFGQGGKGEDNDLGKDAGTVLAENEAAGKNKPASEVPKAKPKRSGKPSLKVVDNAEATA
jgi:hypothetical protein